MATPVRNTADASASMKSPGASAVDISVVVTAHREGNLARRSVKSARRSMEFAEERGAKCEILAILDRPDAATRRYFDRCELTRATLAEVNFGDLATSRNYGAGLASGRYVAFLDADDLFSENWLERAFQFASHYGDQPVVLHPEISVYFGHALRLWRHRSLIPTDPDRLNLLQANYWTALAFVPRELVLAVPYTPDQPDAGFGYEDWYWNCETLSQGAPHHAVPGTAHFIRMKPNTSLLQEKNRAGTVLRASALFDTPADGNGEGATPEQAPSADAARSALRFGPGLGTNLERSARLGLRAAYRTARPIARAAVRNRTWARRIAAVARDSARELFIGEARYGPPPDWLASEWRAISFVDPDVFPSQVPTDIVPWYVPPPNPAVFAYQGLYAAMGDEPTHVFVLPWLTRGGADLAALHYMHEVAEDPCNQVVCVTTEPGDSPWLNRVPAGARVIDLARWTPAAPPAARAELLFRILLQKQPRIIHNVNSEMCYDLFIKYGRALSHYSRLVDSAYCEEYSEDGRLEGYALKALPRCFDYVTAVVSDSRAIVDKLGDMFALDSSKFVVAYHPVAADLPKAQPRASTHTTQVLWAGRLCPQKRPDVLAEVARRLTPWPFRFHVFASPGLGGNFDAYRRELRALSNVVWHGSFDGFDSIPRQDFDALLYTSAWDGLPNVLLEAARAGLPIVAPNAGAIGELVSERTGYLVPRSDSIDGYVASLHSLRSDPRSAYKRALAAQALLEERHSRERFRESLASIPGYLSSEPCRGAR